LRISAVEAFAARTPLATLMNSLRVEADPPRLAYSWDWSRVEHIRLHKALLREVRRHGSFRLVRAGVFLVIGAGALFVLYHAFLGNLTPLVRVVPWVVLIGAWWLLFSWLLPRSSARAYLNSTRVPSDLLSPPRRWSRAATPAPTRCAGAKSSVPWKRTSSFFSSTTASARTFSPSGSCKRPRSKTGCASRFAGTFQSTRPLPRRDETRLARLSA
jgi:hypothetical protein